MFSRHFAQRIPSFGGANEQIRVRLWGVNNARHTASKSSGETLPSKPMKTLLTLLAAVGVFSLATPAQAGHVHPQQRRIIVGYTRMGFPIYQWVPQLLPPVHGRPMPLGHWGHYHHDHGLHRGWFKHR